MTNLRTCELCQDSDMQEEIIAPYNDGFFAHKDCLSDAIAEGKSQAAEMAEYNRHHADDYRDNSTSVLNSEQQAWQDQMDAGWEY